MLLGNPGNKRAKILEIILLENPGNYHDTPSFPSLTLCRAEISAFFFSLLPTCNMPTPALGPVKTGLGYIYNILYAHSL